MPILPPERTAAMQAIAERGFTTNREDLAARIMASKEKSKAVENCVASAISQAQRAIEIAEKSREILMNLPLDIISHANCNDSWLQFSRCTREQTEKILSGLSAGRWSKTLSSGGSTFIDYEGVVNGVRVIIYAAPHRQDRAGSSRRPRLYQSGRS